jgi:hypothetical protein
MNTLPGDGRRCSRIAINFENVDHPSPTKLSASSMRLSSAAALTSRYALAAPLVKNLNDGSAAL